MGFTLPHLRMEHFRGLVGEVCGLLGLCHFHPEFQGHQPEYRTLTLYNKDICPQDEGL